MKSTTLFSFVLFLFVLPCGGGCVATINAVHVHHTCSHMGGVACSGVSPSTHIPHFVTNNLNQCSNPTATITTTQPRPQKWHHNNHTIHPTTHKQCSTPPSIVLCSAPNAAVITPPSPDQPHQQPHGHFHALLKLSLRTPCFAVLMSPSSPVRFDAPVCSLVHFIALTPWVMHTTRVHPPQHLLVKSSTTSKAHSNTNGHMAQCIACQLSR